MLRKKHTSKKPISKAVQRWDEAVKKWISNTQTTDAQKGGQEPEIPSLQIASRADALSTTGSTTMQKVKSPDSKISTHARWLETFRGKPTGQRRERRGKTNETQIG